MDFDYNNEWLKFINKADYAIYLPLAPTHTSMGGLNYKPAMVFGLV